MGLNIYHLEYFLEVVRQGSFSKAAATLHLTQPSISKMIKDLENELGVTLIYRHAKQLELTDAGQALYEQAQQVVARFQNLPEELDEVIHLKKGKVRIGIPPITCASVLPRLLGQFKQKFPLIQIQLYEFGSKKIQLGILDGSLDVGIVCTLPAATEPFEVFPCVQDPLRLIVHPEHPLAHETMVDFSLLADEPFVLYAQDFSLYDHILNRCKLAGFQPKIICETSQREFITQMVAARLGIALLPGTICATLDPQAIVSVPFTDPQIYLHLAVIWRKDRYLSFAARSWLDFTTAGFATAAEIL